MWEHTARRLRERVQLIDGDGARHEATIELLSVLTGKSRQHTGDRVVLRVRYPLEFEGTAAALDASAALRACRDAAASAGLRLDVAGLHDDFQPTGLSGPDHGWFDGRPVSILHPVERERKNRRGVYLALCDEGWESLGPFECLSFDPETASFKDVQGHTVASYDWGKRCWHVPRAGDREYSKVEVQYEARHRRVRTVGGKGRLF